MKVCMFGSASDKIDDIYKDPAYELGCAIAEHGHTLVFGGGDYGMMGSCVQGVHDNGGEAIAIVPDWIEDSEGSSKDCSDFIQVERMDERKRLFIEKSDAFIITPGGLGTFDEMFEVMTLKQLKRHDKKIIIFNINDYFTKIFEVLQHMTDEFFLDEELLSHQKQFTHVAATVDEVMEYLHS